jgi:hypothetical protein
MDEANAALKCWERAVHHAERADYLFEQALLMYQQTHMIIEQEKMMAAAYLAAGGFGAEPQAYAELGLPFTGHPGKPKSTSEGDGDEPS